jgi:hypothetical protein
VDDGVDAHHRPPEQRRTEKKPDVDDIHQPHVQHGEVQQRREEEHEHGAVVKRPRDDGMADRCEGRGAEDGEPALFRLAAARLQQQRRGCAEGEQRRTDDHEQQVLEDVGLEVRTRHGGHR